MKKTFCDRCGVECNGQSVQRFTIFDVNRAIDVCENCYSEFFRWLNSEKDKPTPLGVHYSGEMISLDKDGKPMMNKDDSDGLDEFIKDVKNDMSYLDSLDSCCDNCYYIDKKYFDYPCRECIRCDVNNGYVKADHFVKGDENVVDERCCKNCKYELYESNEQPCFSCLYCSDDSLKRTDNFVKKEERR